MTLSLDVLLQNTKTERKNKNKKNDFYLFVTMETVPNNLCMICGITSDGTYRNGVQACKACKSFFLMHCPNADRLRCNRGTLDCLNQDVAVCSNGNVWRFMCRKCRFDKCVRMGMKSKKLAAKSNSPELSEITNMVEPTDPKNGPVESTENTIDNDTIRKFDLCLKCEWKLIPDKIQENDMAGIKNLLLRTCHQAATISVPFFAFSPLFKSINPQYRFLFVSKSIARIVLLMVGLHFDPEFSPVGLSIDNFDTMTACFPSLKVCQHFRNIAN